MEESGKKRKKRKDTTNAIDRLKIFKCALNLFYLSVLCGAREAKFIELTLADSLV